MPACPHLTKSGKPCPCMGNIHVSAEVRRERGKRGGQIRAQAFTSEYQSAARARVKRESLVRAGRAGYEKVGGLEWWALQTEKARYWRFKHPSEPERWVADVLIAHTLESYDREYIVDGDPRAVDFAFPEHCVAIEVNGHQESPSFGEAAARAQKHAAKVAWLESLGWRVHVVNAKDDRASEERRLIEFLKVQGLS